MSRWRLRSPSPMPFWTTAIFTRSDRISPHVRSYCQTFTSKSYNAPRTSTLEGLRDHLKQQTGFLVQLLPIRTLPQACASSAVLRHRQRVPPSAFADPFQYQNQHAVQLSRDLAVSWRQDSVRDRRVGQHLAPNLGLLQPHVHCLSVATERQLEFSPAVRAAIEALRLPEQACLTTPSPLAAITSPSASVARCSACAAVARAINSSLCITVADSSTACCLPQTWFPTLHATLNNVAAASSNLLRYHVERRDCELVSCVSKQRTACARSVSMRLHVNCQNNRIRCRSRQHDRRSYRAGTHNERQPDVTVLT